MIRNLLFTVILAVAGSAYGQDITTLNVAGKQEVQGQKMFRLHALANQQLQAQGEDASQYELVGVTVEAKSKRGRGQATLIVVQDQDTQRVEKFGSNDYFFEITAPWAYNTMHWDLSGQEGKAQERWRMRFNGNIKIRSIQLHVATSTKRVRIDMGGQLMTQESTIFLKRELRRMGYDVRNADLKRVVLVAKSKRGRGQAKLVVGQNATFADNVGPAQNGLGFQSERPASYNRIPFRHSGDSRGRWQIQMRGRIKVKAVIVVFK